MAKKPCASVGGKHLTSVLGKPTCPCFGPFCAPLDGGAPCKVYAQVAGLEAAPWIEREHYKEGWSFFDAAPTATSTLWYSHLSKTLCDGGPWWLRRYNMLKSGTDLGGSLRQDNEWQDQPRPQKVECSQTAYLGSMRWGYRLADEDMQDFSLDAYAIEPIRSVNRGTSGLTKWPYQFAQYFLHVEVIAGTPNKVQAVVWSPGIGVGPDALARTPSATMPPVGYHELFRGEEDLPADWVDDFGRITAELIITNGYACGDIRDGLADLNGTTFDADKNQVLGAGGTVTILTGPPAIDTTAPYGIAEYAAAVNNDGFTGTVDTFTFINTALIGTCAFTAIGIDCNTEQPDSPDDDVPPPEDPPPIPPIPPRSDRVWTEWRRCSDGAGVGRWKPDDAPASFDAVVIERGGECIQLGFNTSIGSNPPGLADNGEAAADGFVDCWACDPKFELTPCDTGASIVTDSDLSAYVGDVVEISEASGCYTVSEYRGEPTAEISVTVTASYEDCDGCDSPAPCTCPTDLANSYAVNVDIYESGVFALSETVTVTRSAPPPHVCTWTGVGPSSLYTYTLTLDTSADPDCEWNFGPGEISSSASKPTGDTPVGSYPDYSTTGTSEIRNVVVS